MNSDLVVIGLFGFLTIIIEGLLWGMMGYVIFKTIRISDKFWILGGIVSGLVYFLWDEIIMGQIIGKLGMQINNESVSNVLGDDLFSIEFTDLIFSVVSLIIGFRISKAIVNNMIRKVPIMKPNMTEE